MWGRRPRRITIKRAEGGSRRWVAHAPLAPRAVVVREVRRETPDALTIVLAAEDGRPIPFRAGQYLTHCFDIDGVEERRAYSISAAEGGALACTIKVLADGRVSQHVARSLKAADRYRVIGPGGDFVLDPAFHGPLMFVAGGSGITPVISLLETALAADPQRAVLLLTVNRDAEHAIFAARLTALAEAHPSFVWTSWLTAQQGRPDERQIAAWAVTAPQAQAYLCGPQALMDLAESALRQAGMSGAILRERFVPAPRHMPRPTAPQTIVFKRSQRSVEQRPGESLLEAGLRADVALEFSCTVGGCGHCKVRVLDGDVLLEEPNCLSEQERAAGYTLACSACATTTVTIDA